MVNVKLGNKIYTGINAIKMNTADGGSTIFSQSKLNKVSAINISLDADIFTITFEDGTSTSGSVTFDDSGLPVNMSDDRGNSLSYTDGFPDSVGNTITISGG